MWKRKNNINNINVIFKNHVITLNKTILHNSTPIHNKILNKLRIEEFVLNLIKGISQKKQKLKIILYSRSPQPLDTDWHWSVAS